MPSGMIFDPERKATASRAFRLIVSVLANPLKFRSPQHQAKPRTGMSPSFRRASAPQELEGASRRRGSLSKSLEKTHHRSPGRSLRKAWLRFQDSLARRPSRRPSASFAVPTSLRQSAYNRLPKTECSASRENTRFHAIRSLSARNSKSVPPCFRFGYAPNMEIALHPANRRPNSIALASPLPTVATPPYAFRPSIWNQETHCRDILLT